MTQEDSIKTNQAATVIDFIIKHRTRFSAKLLIWATCGITRALHSNVPANPAGAHIGVLEPVPFLHHIKKCPFYVCVFFFFFMNIQHLVDQCLYKHSRYCTLEPG